jgi:hypothetical protein
LLSYLGWLELYPQLFPHFVERKRERERERERERGRAGGTSSESLVRPQYRAVVQGPAIGGVLGWGPDGCIKVLYCFHQNNADSKCEAVHTSPPIRP